MTFAFFAFASPLVLASLLASWANADAFVNVSGSPVLVWRGGTSPGSCDPFAIPDAPARAWRTKDGQVTLVATWATARAARGASLQAVEKQCDVLFNSTFSGYNSLYIDHEWLLAPWILPNQTVMGYMHQEYHGWQHNNCSVPQKDVNADCWMVAMTSTVSHDGGKTFQHTAAPPGHLAVSAPYQYAPDKSEFGYGDPSGIVQSPKDGMYYMMVHQRRPFGQMQAGTCLLQSADVSNHRGWRGWNGTGFGSGSFGGREESPLAEFPVRFEDPYAAGFDPATAAQHACAPVTSMKFTLLSLKWSTYFDRFIGVGQGQLQGKKGVWYQFSLTDDLLHWDDPLPIRPKLQNSTGGAIFEENYASVLDPASDDPNFNTVGETALFYYTSQQHGPGEQCTQPGCRDLYYEPIRFGGKET